MLTLQAVNIFTQSFYLKVQNRDISIPGTEFFFQRSDLSFKILVRLGSSAKLSLSISSFLGLLLKQFLEFANARVATGNCLTKI